MWEAGVEMEWEKMREGEERRRVWLPSYPFERQRYWADPRIKKAGSNVARNKDTDKKAEISEWLYVPVWKQSISPDPLEAGELIAQNSRWLVFSDGSDFGLSLIQRLMQEGQEVIAVACGEEFSKPSENSFRISAHRAEDYDRLILDLKNNNKTPCRILHMWSVSERDRARSFDESQDLGFYSLLYLAQAFGKNNVVDQMQIDFLSSNAQRVMTGEELCPEKATAVGPILVIPQEYPNIICRSIDIAMPEPGQPADDLTEQLLAELVARSTDNIVAYRGMDRWVQAFEKVQLTPRHRARARLREKGVYLITGGLGLVGLHLAEHLARTVQAKLVLISRSSFSETTEWVQWLEAHQERNATSRKIRRLQSIEEHGSEVLIIRADVANREQMRKALSSTYKRFGALHGVIHAAGIVDRESFRPIQETRRSECEWHFRPKIKGAMVLDELLRGKQIDFCILTSSIASVLGGLGHTAYSAANLFMDAFSCTHCSSENASWMSVIWDGWLPEEIEGETSDKRMPLAITACEGAEVFDRILLLPTLPKVIVSTSDLQLRIDRWVRPGFLEDKQTAGTDSSAEVVEKEKLTSKGPAVSPLREVEQKVVEVWQELFGIEQIGEQDDFFELGGDSLLAIRLISHLREMFQVDLPLLDVLESPTASHMAFAISEAQNRKAASESPDPELAELNEILEASNQAGR